MAEISILNLNLIKEKKIVFFFINILYKDNYFNNKKQYDHDNKRF